MTEEEKRLITDNTEHMLSGGCVVSKAAGVIDALADVRLAMMARFPEHIFNSEVMSVKLRSRWLLNPSCETLGEHRIPPDELQLHSIDVKIRTYFHRLLVERYKKLKQHGFNVRRYF